MKNFTINIQDIYTKTIIFILVIASYINIMKPLTGIRWWPILIDIVLFLLITVGLFLINLLVRKEYVLLFSRTELFLVIFIIISFIEIFNSNVPSLGAGLEGFRKTTYQMAGFFLGVYFIKNIGQAEKIIKYLYYFSIPILLYGIKQFFYFSSFDQKIIDANLAGYWTYHIAGRVRALSIFSGPFHFGMFSCMMVLLSLYYYMKRGKYSYLILFLISVFGVFSSMTRTNIVALFVSCLFFLFFIKAEKQKFFKVINIMLVLLVFILIIMLFNGFLPISRVIGSFSNISGDQRFLNRFPGYKEMIGAFAKHPITGYGMGSAGDTLGKLYDWKVRFTSHNLLFKILIETGVVGLVVYLLFFLAWFKKAFSLVKSNNIFVNDISVLAISIVSVLLVNGIVGSAVEAYPINLYVWFFMGVLVRIWWLEKSQDRAEIKIANK